jgi:SusD family.
MHFYFLFVTWCCLAGCNKSKFLDEKPRSDLFVPTTLEDFQLLLDNETIMNETPVLGEISADNFYTTFNFWQTLAVKEQFGYIWAPDIYRGEGNIGDWNVPYQQVFTANVILEGLPKIKVSSANEKHWKNTKGSALFFRAYAFHNLVQLFSPVFDESTAINDLGVPLRLRPNIEDVVSRSSVRETYQRIIADLSEATQLLEDVFHQNNRNRPSKAAAYALLARVYLSMGLYDKAGLYADSCLKRYDTLIDYNTLNSTTGRPFDRNFGEALLQSRLLSTTGLIKASTFVYCIVDSSLYNSYNDNDLRKLLFYQINNDGLPILKFGYNGSALGFSGLATDEMYLIRAECYARQGKKDQALADLNSLMQMRWKKDMFTPFTAATADEALNLILTERRKELPFRGLRWTDLRRLNKEGANITLTRILNGTTYTLPPNSRLYTLPIPPDVIQLGGIEQNIRE